MKTVKEWPSNERIDAIGTNGNDGLHYPTESECPLSPNFVDGPKTLGDEEGMDKCLGDVAKLFNLKYGVDCGWGNLADEIEAKLACTTCEAVKPIYTQAMCDAGEYPSVGMECLWGGHNNDFVPCKVLCIDAEQWFMLIDGQHRIVGNPTNFKPHITLEDGKAYQFYCGRIVTGIYSAEDGALVTPWSSHEPALCTNIQPLTLEGE